MNELVQRILILFFSIGFAVSSILFLIKGYIVYIQQQSIADDPVTQFIAGASWGLIGLICMVISIISTCLFFKK